MLLVLRVSFFSPVVLLLSLFWCLTQIRTTGTKQTDCTWWWYFASPFGKMRNLLGNSWPLLRELYWSFVLRSSLLVVQISNTKCSIFSASGNNVRFFCFVIWKNERRNRFFAQHALAVGCYCGPTQFPVWM